MGFRKCCTVGLLESSWAFPDSCTASESGRQCSSNGGWREDKSAHNSNTKVSLHPNIHGSSNWDDLSLGQFRESLVAHKVKHFVTNSLFALERLSVTEGGFSGSPLTVSKLHRKQAWFLYSIHFLVTNVNVCK